MSVERSVIPLESALPRPESSSRLTKLFWVEGMASLAGTTMTMGIFFYTEHRFGWDLWKNFVLAATQGAAYVLGSLLADSLSRRFGRRAVLLRVYSALAAISLLPIVFPSPGFIMFVLPLYMFTIGLTWPAIESLVAAGAEPTEMSRRLGFYNLVWSGVGAAGLAMNGTLIRYFPSGMFILPAAMHLASMVVLRTVGEGPRGGQHVHAAPEEALFARRRLALTLSRIALPATYMVAYSLAALLPLLPVIQSLPVALRTVAGSIWLATRWITFFVMGRTTAWHARPLILLWAAAAMFLSFIGATVHPGDFVPALASDQLALSLLVLSQAVLGVCIGLIYFASLYFGMVLSAASTEHAGYHEALIGLGCVLGPGAGLAGLAASNGNVGWGIATVAAAIGASVVAAAIGAVLPRKKSIEDHQIR